MKSEQAKQAGIHVSRIIEALEEMGFEVKNYYAEAEKVDLTVKYPSPPASQTLQVPQPQ